MPFIPTSDPTSHDLAEDIKGPVLVVDDLELKLTPIGPSRYKLLAEYDARLCTVVRQEDTMPQFVCSCDNYAEARRHVERLNGPISQDELTETQICNETSVIRRMMDTGIQHDAIMGTLRISGYSYSTPEFQHVMAIYNEYVNSGSKLPFTLSLEFAQLLKINKLAARYLKAAEIISAALPITATEALDKLVIDLLKALR